MRNFFEPRTSIEKWADDIINNNKDKDKIDKFFHDWLVNAIVYNTKIADGIFLKNMNSLCKK